MSEPENKLVTVANQLKKLKIDHVKYREAYKDCYSALTFSDPGDFVLMVGPSRVGKSKISETICDEFNNKKNPLCAIRVILHVGGAKDNVYDPKDLTISILDKLGHPFYSSQAFQDGGGLGNESGKELFIAMIESIKTNKTRFIVLDEAHHAIHCQSARALSAFLDSWKSLAEDTGAVILMTGTYELLSVFDYAPHLIGRSEIIEFSRYKIGEEHDISDFRDIISAYEEILIPVLEKKKLEPLYKLLTTGSIGCIGHLRKWLVRAIRHSHSHYGDHFKIDSIVKTRKTYFELKKLEAYTLLGEELTDNQLDWKNAAKQDLFDASSNNLPRKKKRRRPFQANPRRYPVGD